MAKNNGWLAEELAMAGAAGLMGMLTARGVNMDSSGGGSGELEASDVSAAMAYAKLSSRQENLMRAKWCGDMQAARALYYDVTLLGVDLALEHGWKVCRGRPYIQRISQEALSHVLAPRVCLVCAGEGVPVAGRGVPGVRQDGRCVPCLGTGVRRDSKRGIAGRLQMDKKTFSVTWEPRYHRVIAELEALLGEAERAVSAAVEKKTDERALQKPPLCPTIFPSLADCA